MFSIFKTKYQKVKEQYHKYERYLIPTFLFVGFVIDYITFTHIQITTALLMLSVHFTLAGASIVFIHFYDAGRITHKLKFVRLYTPLLIQFTFGALLGATFIFYWFSASLSVSWPFILLILVLIVSNEIYKQYLAKPVVQVGVYVFIIFSYISIVFPYLFTNVSAGLFVIASLVSLCFMQCYIWLVAQSKGEIAGYKKRLQKGALGLVIVMNALYFAHIIPPIPLSLRDSGVYHVVRRAGNQYIAQAEPETFFQKLTPGYTVHLTPNQGVYVYTAIFAPAEVGTAIIHQWQQYNESENSWIDRDRLSYSLTGGRTDGYRGYSYKHNIDPGKWRVSVETESGNVVGRVSFTIEQVHDAIETYPIFK